MATFLPARNFTGRSAYLRQWINGSGIFVGEIPSNYVSGLATTVKDEILLHDKYPAGEASQAIKQLLSDIGFGQHDDKNPFELSGGEQAMLAIACGLLPAPEKLSIDTTLEQLHRKWRGPLVKLFNERALEKTGILIADNRVGEYGRPGHLPFTDHFQPQPGGDGAGPGFRDLHFAYRQLDWQPARTLSLNHIGFSYVRNRPVLKDCSFSFHPGHIYHLTGENGAGKSTLAKILSGLYKPASGELLLDGRNENFYRYPGNVLGYNFQSPDDQLFSASVRKELMQARAVKRPGFAALFDYIVELFGLQDLLDQHPADLPFTMRKRISIASTLINEREWYVFDEPTLGQDELNITALRDLMLYLAQEGKGIILISHSEDFIRKFNNIVRLTLIHGNLAI